MVHGNKRSTCIFINLHEKGKDFLSLVLKENVFNGKIGKYPVPYK